jgi:hypothetical protein
VEKAEERRSRLIKTLIEFRRDRREAVFLFALFAAVHWSRLAHDCVRGTAPIRTRLDNNGQTAILARDGYDVNESTRTSASWIMAYPDRLSSS